MTQKKERKQREYALKKEKLKIKNTKWYRSMKIIVREESEKRRRIKSCSRPIKKKFNIFEYEDFIVFGWHLKTV